MRNTCVEYRDLAAECLRLSRGTDNPAIRAFYVTLAQAWATLADQAEARALLDATAAGATLLGLVPEEGG